MKLIIASNNAHKVAEIKQILSDYFSELCTLKEAGLNIDVVEDGLTFEANALKKATEVLKAAPQFDAALADDSGLMVDALGGAPGVYSARYSGEEHDEQKNNRKLMQELSDVAKEDRTAQFACSIALVRHHKEPVVVTGFANGEILFAPRGDNGFGYDPYFYYPPLQKTFAELPSEQKNLVSHRHNALQLLKEQLNNECENWSLF